MSFVRSLAQKEAVKNNPLFATLLHDDVKAGSVFPAVRSDELHFYCGGGCLFKFSGKSFKRNRAYDGGKDGYVTEASYGKSFIDGYEDFKDKNTERFISEEEEKPQERQFLEPLYAATYKASTFPEVCVLDIEVRVNEDKSQRKCDMVLFHSKSNAIMFVEAKLFGDSRVRRSIPEPPEVIEQVERYTKLICKNKARIEEQYTKYFDIVSALFGTKRQNDAPLTLIPEAKLLVYQTPCVEGMTENQLHSFNTINKSLCTMWVKEGETPSLVNIWNMLNGGRRTPCP